MSASILRRGTKWLISRRHWSSHLSTHLLDSWISLWIWISWIQFRSIKLDVLELESRCISLWLKCRSSALWLYLEEATLTSTQIRNLNALGLSRGIKLYLFLWTTLILVEWAHILSINWIWEWAWAVPGRTRSLRARRILTAIWCRRCGRRAEILI